MKGGLHQGVHPAKCPSEVSYDLSLNSGINLKISTLKKAIITIDNFGEKSDGISLPSESTSAS
jgi:hypothetical protein